MPASHGHQFDASSPVGRHWLVHGVGFSVCDRNGRKLGVVEDVAVDPERHCAAELLMRRRGLVRRPRYVTIAPGAIESVLPGSQLFLVAAAERTTVTFGTRAKTRALRLAVAARSAVWELARVFRLLAQKVERGLEIAAGVTARSSRRAGTAGAAAALRAAVVSRRVASTTAAAGIRAGGRVRREAPRAAAWLSTRSHEAGRTTLTLLRSLGLALRRIARVVADVSVTAALLVVAAVRRAAASASQPRKPPQQPGLDGAEWRTDADAPLARDTGGRRIVARRSPAERRSRRR